MKSKRYRKIVASLEPQKTYNFTEAVQVLLKNNFEQSNNLEVSFALNWSAKQNNIRDFVFIPYPVKKEKFAIVDEEVPANIRERSDIVFIKLEDLSKIISKKKKSSWGFNKLMAHSSLTGQLRPFAKVLSLKKSFPNYKDGTLTDDLSASVEELDKGRLELRNDKGGNFHVIVGKSSFKVEQIESNFQVVFNKIVSLKPSNWKGEYLRGITISTTMGPGLKISF